MSADALLLWDIDGTLIAATGHDERRLATGGDEVRAFVGGVLGRS